MRKSAPAIDPWDRLKNLPPAALMLLRIMCLLHPMVNKTNLIKGLAKAGLRAPDGRAWAYPSLNRALEELRAAGLVSESMECVPELRHRVAVDAVGPGDGREVLKALERGFPAHGMYDYYTRKPDEDALRRLMRLAAYANEPDSLTAYAQEFDKHFAPKRAAPMLAAMFPADIEWQAARHPQIQAMLVAGLVAEFLGTGIAPPGLAALVAACRDTEDSRFAAVRLPMLQVDLLSGRLAAVRVGLEALPGSLDKLALQGGLAFLEGQNELALTQYREALKQLRKLRRKRSAYFEDAHGPFFALALLRANDAGLHAELQNCLAAGVTTPSLYQEGYFAIQALLWLLQGVAAKPAELLKKLRTRMPAEPLSAAMVGLAEFHLDASLAREHAVDHAKRFAALRDSLPLVACIHAEILAEVAPTPALCREFVDGFGLGVRFTGLMAVSAPWERALASLDAFLGGGAVAVAGRRDRRLAWFVDPATRMVDVAEQTARGQDGWSDGRAVSLRRLREGDPRIDYLTDQDRRALRAITPTMTFYHDTQFVIDPARALLALIGHPAVFDARQRAQPIELVAGAVELVVTERMDGFHVALSHSASDAAVFLEPETPSRYRVTEFPKRLLAVQEILGTTGLNVPQNGRDRLVALVRTNNPDLPVRDEIGMTDANAPQGDPTPVVQCAPLNDGLKLAIVVRPFGAAGPAYLAGAGGKSVPATVDGQKLRVRRDLPRELEERAALFAACPTLRERAGGDMQMVIIEELESSLEVLSELAAYTGPHHIEWPEGRKLLVKPASFGMLKLRVGRERDWFNVEGELAIDDEQVLEMRYLLDRLDRAQGRFIKLDDGSFLALTRQLQAQLQRLGALSEPHGGGRRVHAFGAPALAGVLEEAGEVSADAAWKKHVGKIKAAEGWTPRLPAGLKAELRDYQFAGFAWLSRLARWGAGACLADDMGLGKTVQAIAVLLERAGAGPCLVVAPTSVVANWESELARFAPGLTSHRLAQAADRAARIAGLGKREVLLCSYGLLHQEAEALSAVAWQMVVLDEAQAIKNAQSRRAQASLSLQAEFRLALSGTPVENDLDELWSLFSFVNPGLLGSREGFQKRFALPIERDRNVEARQALRSLVRPFLLRRTKAAVLSELPARTEQTMRIEMSAAERAFYEALRQKALDNIAALDAPKGKRKLHILTEITRLRRACCNPALIDPAAGVSSAKLETFLQLVEELRQNGHRALVFSQYVAHLTLVRAALDARGVTYEYLDGSTPAGERERRVAAFQTGEAELFLISLRAGGTGLNLTAADYVVHLDPWWNPAVEDQASDRAHRMGQTKPVTIYRLVMQGSIEESILALHRDKRDLAADVLEGAEITARLSEEDLVGLIKA